MVTKEFQYDSFGVGNISLTNLAMPLASILEHSADKEKFYTSLNDSITISGIARAFDPVFKHH